jgi:predicted nucleotidyltransferase
MSKTFLRRQLILVLALCAGLLYSSKATSNRWPSSQPRRCTWAYLSAKLPPMPSPDRQSILASARDALLSAFPNAWAIYVYGSFARGDESPASDVDLAVLLPPDETIADLLGVISEVATRIHREVDLVDLRRVSDVLRREVLTDSQTLYISRPDQVLEWEGTAISRYQRYREEVRALLEDFASTGIGYGR